MQILTGLFFTVLGIFLVYSFACMLKDVYTDLAEQVEDEINKETYTLEVDVDPDTGQRTSTIIKD